MASRSCTHTRVVNKSDAIARPFLKWVGGKRSILPELLKRMPKNYKAYHEPFLGGGALFFSLQPKRAFLSDVNGHLITAYTAVRDTPEAAIGNYANHFKRHTREYYYKAREQLHTEKDTVKCAALFMYLNRTCFNGLYRENKSGLFNVPLGTGTGVIDEENMRNCSKVLKQAAIACHDFKQAKISRGDFYYLDPPYHKTFSTYDASGFGENEHTELAEFCHAVDRNGGYFMLSNSDTPFVRKLYNGYHIEVVRASRSVSCKGNGRGRANELLIRNYQ